MVWLRTSGRSELESDSSRSLMRSWEEMTEPQELRALLGPTGSPRLAMRRSAHKLRLELLGAWLRGFAKIVV